MLEVGGVFDETTENGGGHEPATNDVRAGIDGAEIDGERGSEILAGDFGGDDFEIGEETFFVFDDFGLGGVDADVVGGAETFILDHDRERVWDGGFDFEREGIVGEDLTFVEIFYREAWARKDSDTGGGERNGDIKAVLTIAENAGDEEFLGAICGGVGGGDENPFHLTDGAGRDDAGAVDGVEVLQGGRRMAKRSVASSPVRRRTLTSM